MKGINKIRASKKRKGFFLKYFSSYLLVLFVPLILAVFTYFMAADIISTQCNNHVKNLLIQTRDVTDARLRELKSIALALKSNENLSEFHQNWNRNDDMDNIFPAYKACHSIPKYIVVNSSVDDVILFFGKPSCCFLLTSGNAVSYTKDMQQKVFLDNTNIDYASLYQYLTTNYFYEQFVVFNSSKTPITKNVYYLASMDMFPQYNTSAVIMIKMSNSFFIDMLSNVSLDDCGTSFIVNENNTVISYFHGENSPNLDDDTLTELIQRGEYTEDGTFLYNGNQVNLIRSDYNGWTYYSLIPHAVIIKDMTTMHNLITAVTIIVLALGIFICYLLTKKNSRPLKHVIESLTTVYEHGFFDSTNDFKFIENAVSALVNSNYTYMEQEKYRLQLIDNEVLRKLFLGEYTTISGEFEKELSQSSIRLEQKLYVTGYLHIHGLKRNDMKPFSQYASFLISFSKRLSDTFSGDIYPLIVDNINMVFIIVHDSSQPDELFFPSLKKALENLGRTTLQETGCHFDFFLSEPMYHFENVQKGYTQCKQIACDVIKSSDRFVYTARDSPPFQQIYRYTIDQELKLIQLLQYGSSEELQHLLDELFRQNFEDIILSDGMKQNFITAIQSSIMRNLSSFQSNGEINTLLIDCGQAKNTEELFCLLISLQSAVQNEIRISTKKNTEEKKRTILDYINKNYGNCNLNTYILCEELDISAQSVCKFFQSIGSSFSAILEDVRIEAACALLRKGEMTIKGIAGEIGYSSDASFRRAFKRVLGISPSSYIKCCCPDRSCCQDSKENQKEE